MNFVLAIGVATAAWFVLAAILFFNPIVDKIYRSEEGHPSVNQLPQTPQTIGKILFAVFIQCAIWAYVYTLVRAAFPPSLVWKASLFGLIIAAVKVLPRDIDRVLLTTYPRKRLTIEFVIGLPCAFVVGLVFAYFL